MFFDALARLIKVLVVRTLEAAIAAPRITAPMMIRPMVAAARDSTITGLAGAPVQSKSALPESLDPVVAVS